MHPIFSEAGNYPKEMIDQIKLFSPKPRFLNSRLPEFTDEEILKIKNSCDFFGLNIHTSVLVRYRNHSDPADNKDPMPSFYHDVDVVESVHPVCFF